MAPIAALVPQHVKSEWFRARYATLLQARLEYGWAHKIEVTEYREMTKQIDNSRVKMIWLT
jgi:hypothetical protein